MGKIKPIVPSALRLKFPSAEPFRQLNGVVGNRPKDTPWTLNAGISVTNFPAGEVDVVVRNLKSVFRPGQSREWIRYL